MPNDAQTPESWAPYAPEFPDWHVWEAVSGGGVLFARLPRSSPPVVVRAKGPDALAAAIRAWYKGRQR
jgi:hypothetical protein